MRVGTAARMLIAGAWIAGCSSSGGGPGGADAGIDTPPALPFPAECRAPDGVYDVTDENNQPIQIVIVGGRLAGIGGKLCHDPYYGPDVPTVKGASDSTCLNNKWCEQSYQCDAAGLCFHYLSVVQEASTGKPHWELTGAANTGCVRHASPWNLGPAPCQPICSGISACDGCGGTNCPTPPVRYPLGYSCTTASDCEAGLVCAGPVGDKECGQPCTTHADCAGLHDASGAVYRSCHNCTYSIADNTYTATNICVRTTVCGAGGGNGNTDACAACLDACRGLGTGCCTGLGCICDSDC